MRRLHLRSLSSAVLVLGFLVGRAGVLRADDPADASARLETFGEIVQVNVVNVEVYVTDKDGKPVTGLEADDFELAEDGKPMTISNFFAVEDGRRLDPKAEEATPAPPVGPGVELRRDGSVVREDERLRLVVFIDNVNIRSLERKRIMSGLRQFLSETIRPDDRVMLVTYDHSLVVRQPFTNDSSRINAALREVEELRGEGNQYDLLRRRIVEGLDEKRTDVEALQSIRPYADLVFHDTEQTIDALRDLVDLLSGLPGRKAVLHVSSGLPMIAAGELFSAVTERFEVSSVSELAFYDASRSFESLGAYANSHGVTFYPLDAAGLRIDRSKTAEEQGIKDVRMAQRIDSELEANVQAPLHYLAEATGGVAILNRNEVLPALEEAARDFRSYYSLGYMPSHYGDGRYYEIQVKVKDRKDLEVRHREGYRDQDFKTRMSDGTRAALLHDYQSNPLGIDVTVGAGTPRDDAYLVPIEIRIPLAGLVLLPSEGQFHARIRLYVGVVDEEGRMSDVTETPLGLKIPGEVIEAAQKESWLYRHQLLMRKGRQKISIGIRDEFGAQESFVSRPVRLGD